MVSVLVPADFNTVERSDGALLPIVDGNAVGEMAKGSHHFSEIANTTMGGIESLEEPPSPREQSFPLSTDEDLTFRQNYAGNLYEGTDKALIADTTDNCRWNTSIPNWLYAMAAAPDRVLEPHMKKSETASIRCNSEILKTCYSKRGIESIFSGREAATFTHLLKTSRRMFRLTTLWQCSRPDCCTALSSRKAGELQKPVVND